MAHSRLGIKVGSMRKLRFLSMTLSVFEYKAGYGMLKSELNWPSSWYRETKIFNCEQQEPGRNDEPKRQQVGSSRMAGTLVKIRSLCATSLSFHSKFLSLT